MNRRRRIGVFMILLLAGLNLTIQSGQAQTSATQRLVQLVQTDDPTRVMAEIMEAAIDAGPPAIPFLEGLIGGTSNQRLFALGSIAMIGGEAALPVVRQHSARGKYGNEDLTSMLAVALASVDSPQNRRELIQMLSPDGIDEETNRLAAISLAILREKDALPPLKVLRQSKRIADDPEEIDLALDWIQKGYWTTAMTPSNERSRVVAAVLRVGIPNLTEKDQVIDEDGYWRHSSLGWVQMQGKPATGQGPPVKVHIGTEGSRDLMFARDLQCGETCRTTHVIFLRKENST
jgi:hypothetical protein